MSSKKTEIGSAETENNEDLEVPLTILSESETATPTTENTEAADEVRAASDNVGGDGINEELRSRPDDAEGKPINQPAAYGNKALTKKQKVRFEVKRWLVMFAGIIMMSASVYFFQTPNDFTLGGIAGVAIIISSFVTPLVSFFTQGVIMMVINVILLIVGFIVLGKQCTLKTVVCSLFYTGIIWIFEYVDLLGIIAPETHKLTGDVFLELVYAILLFGIGGALVFNSGSSSGGTDIVALILKKHTNLNVGMALLIIDTIVVLVSFYTFSLECALYSVMGLFTKSFLLDSVIESIGKTKYITIITENPDIISEYILKVINHGYTVYDAEGGYTHTPKKILVTVCKRGEALKLKLKIHSVDPTAFVIITDANEILGKGFNGMNGI